MRTLVLSDLHANLTALQTALNAADGHWDRVVCLGDVVGYGPDPNEVATTIREMGATTIRGNHDKAVADLMPTDDFNPVAKMAVNWTRSQLSNGNLDWLASLPHGPLEAEGLVLVHGAFQDEDEYVFTPAQALEGLLDAALPLTFYGHTHHQGRAETISAESRIDWSAPRRRSAMRIRDCGPVKSCRGVLASALRY
jgi:predicted phosphodiesterase